MGVQADEFDYGFMSNHWMLKMGLMYVPRPQLNLAIAKMIDFMVYSDNFGVEEAFQVLAQIAFTGTVISTTQSPYTPVDPSERLSDDQLEAEVEKFKDFLHNLSPDATDPMIDFRLPADTDEEDN